MVFGPLLHTVDVLLSHNRAGDAISTGITLVRKSATTRMILEKQQNRGSKRNENVMQ